MSADDAYMVTDSKVKLRIFAIKFGAIYDWRKLRLNAGKNNAMKCTKKDMGENGIGIKLSSVRRI